MDQSTTRFIAVVITIVWSISVLSAIWLPEYHPPVEMHAIMGLVAGSLFGRDAIKRLRNGNGNGAT